MSHLKERRRFPRLNEGVFFLYQFMEKKDMDIMKGFTNNISTGGLMFETDRPISAEDLFILEIYQPLRQFKEEIISISTAVKVRWVTQIDRSDKYEGSNKYRIGVEFVEIDKEERKTIAKYMQNKLNA